MGAVSPEVLLWEGPEHVGHGDLLLYVQQASAIGRHTHATLFLSLGLTVHICNPTPEGKACLGAEALCGVICGKELVVSTSGHSAARALCCTYGLYAAPADSTLHLRTLRCTCGLYAAPAGTTVLLRTQHWEPPTHRYNIPALSTAGRNMQSIHIYMSAVISKRTPGRTSSSKDPSSGHRQPGPFTWSETARDKQILRLIYCYTVWCCLCGARALHLDKLYT